MKAAASHLQLTFSGTLESILQHFPDAESNTVAGPTLLPHLTLLRPLLCLGVPRGA